MPSHRSRLLFEEFLESSFEGSIYHPNLAAFNVDLENGLDQRKEKFQSSTNDKFENSYLNRFHILSNFLKEKPYAFFLSADRSRETQNREFFERQIINSTKYGGSFGYQNSFIPVDLTLSNESKTIDRISLPSQDYQDDQMNLSLSNNSKVIGDSRFNFMQDDFSRIESDTRDQKGTSRDFTLSNEKSLSEKKDLLLNSNLHYYSLTGTRKNDILNLNERLNITHNDFLSSMYGYNFSDRSSEHINAKDNKFNVDFMHHLYESLNSSLNLRYFNSDATNFSQQLYGLSINEDYVKKLGKLGKINLGFGLDYEEEKREASGSLISVIDEVHTLTTGEATFLDNSNVDAAAVVVTDTTGTIGYTVNVDYLLITFGSRLQIQRITGGSISNGQQVLVDYQASMSPLFKFNTLGENARIQMYFLDEILSVFYRVSHEDHPAVKGEQNAILQTLTDKVYGLSVNYKDLRVEWENEDYDSNLTPYKRQGLKESLLLKPSFQSTYIIQSSQNRLKLMNTQDTQKFFDIINKYIYSLNSTTRLNVEAGYRWQRGENINLNDLTGGLGLEVNLGMFIMSTEYDFEKRTYLGDDLVNHLFYTKIKRRF